MSVAPLVTPVPISWKLVTNLIKLSKRCTKINRFKNERAKQVPPRKAEKERQTDRQGERIVLKSQIGLVERKKFFTFSPFFWRMASVEITDFLLKFLFWRMKEGSRRVIKIELAFSHLLLFKRPFCRIMHFYMKW